MEKREELHFIDLVRTGGTQTILPDELISAQGQGLIRVKGRHPTGRLNVSLTPQGYEAALSFPRVEAEVLDRFSGAGVKRLSPHEQPLVDLLQKRGLLFVSTFGNAEAPVRRLSSEGERRLALLKKTL